MRPLQIDFRQDATLAHVAPPVSHGVRPLGRLFFHPIARSALHGTAVVRYDVPHARKANRRAPERSLPAGSRSGTLRGTTKPRADGCRHARTEIARVAKIAQ